MKNILIQLRLSGLPNVCYILVRPGPCTPCIKIWRKWYRFNWCDTNKAFNSIVVLIWWKGDTWHLIELAVSMYSSICSQWHLLSKDTWYGNNLALIHQLISVMAIWESAWIYYTKIKPSYVTLTEKLCWQCLRQASLILILQELWTIPFLVIRFILDHALHNLG